MPKPPERVKPGDTLSISRWNTLVDYVRANWVLTGQGGGLQMTQGPSGKYLAVRRPSDAYPAITLASAAGRSGTTLGSTSVTLIYANGGSISSTSTTLATVYNIASSSIASSAYCWVQQDPNGAWWFTAVEC